MTHDDRHPSEKRPASLAPYRAASPVLPEERRALDALAMRGAICRRVGESWIVVARKNGVSLRVASINPAILSALHARAWIVQQEPKSVYVITPAGRRALASKLTPTDYQAATQSLAVTETEEGTRLVLNRDENALARVARMKKPDGSPFLDQAGIAAGERLAAEIMRAGMVPGVTMRWDAAGSSGDHRTNPTDLMIAARQRVEAALDFVGPEFAGLMIDLLAFSKGVEEIERERRWPARSAKIVIAMALSRLAQHYGFAAEARGADLVRSRVWRAEGARPTQW